MRKKATTEGSDRAQSGAEPDPSHVSRDERNHPLDPEIEFSRPRGCYTKLQREGFSLSQTADITPIHGGAFTIEVQGVYKHIVVVTETRCTCDRYRNARPRMLCEHVWAVFYSIDPPQQSEFEIPVAEPGAPTMPAKDAPVDPSAKRLDAIDVRPVLGGGWSRFTTAYENALQSEFVDVTDLALAVFKQYAGDSLWRPQGDDKRGRHSYPLWLMLFAEFARIFNGFTLRGTQGFLEFLVRDGYLDVPRIPQFATIGAFNRTEHASPIIHDAIFLTASPFRSIARLRTAGDGTGWSSHTYGDHRKEHRDGKKEAREQNWWRAVLVCDVDALCVLSAWVTAEAIGEKKALEAMLPGILDRGWDIGALLLDAGFDDTLLRDSLIDDGVKPYIPYKDGRVHAIPRKHERVVRHPDELTKLFHMFSQFQAEFRETYRFRVKVECLISTLKRRFSSFVRSRCEAGARNDILMMCVCHNFRMINNALHVIEEIKRESQTSSDGNVRHIGNGRARKRSSPIPDLQLRLIDGQATLS